MKRRDILQRRILSTVAKDLGRVEEDLLRLLRSESGLLYQISYQLLRSGGKRLRPALVLLSGRFFEYSLQRVLPIAVAMELVHTATLIHDDIIDESVKRRGKETVNYRYGDKIAVLNGDLLFAHAVKFLSQMSDRSILEEMLEIIFAMCRGEVDEVTSNHHLSTDLSLYLKRIERKTALMFAKSCEFGARVCGASKEEGRRLREYGINLGMAFQIMDDLRDLTETEEVLGKPPGEDLRQGIMTLPMIFALKESPERDLILEVLETKDPKDIKVTRTLASIRESNALQETLRVVGEYRERSIQSLKGLPLIPERHSLEGLVDFITREDHLDKGSLYQKRSL